MPDTPDTQPPSFEVALDQLQNIVHELEEGQIGLETSLARFEEGIRLLKSCHAVLQQAEQRIEILIGVDSAGKPQTAPFDATASMEITEQSGPKAGRRRATVKRTTVSTSEEASLETPPEDSLF